MSSRAQNEGRIARSWRLTKTAWKLVRTDHALLILAAFSGLLGVLGIAAILGLSDLIRPAHVGREWRRALAAIVLAYPLTFAGVFLNTAVAAAAAAVLENGRRLSVKEALAVPARRAGQVALWALLATIVGVVLEQIASRLPLLANIATRLLGLAWSLASLFAIPILAVEGCPAPECLRRSARLVKKRWGEGISGNVIITAWMALVLVPVAVVVGIGLGASRHAPGARDTFIALGALLLLTSIAVSGVVRQTFAVALFRYAETGVAQGPFQLEDLQAPFSTKTRLRSLGERSASDRETLTRKGRLRLAGRSCSASWRCWCCLSSALASRCWSCSCSSSPPLASIDEQEVGAASWRPW
jgi:hypothetical protein